MQPMRAEFKNGHYEVRPFLPGELDNYELDRLNSFVKKAHISKIRGGLTSITLGLTWRYCATAFSGLGVAASPGLVVLGTIALVGGGLALIVWGISCLPVGEAK